MFEELTSLVLASALTLGSPGPAPISLALVSSNFGIKKGLNYLFGILAGLLMVTTLVGFGLFEVLKLYPNLMTALGVFAFLYMVFIAYKIAFSDISLAEAGSPPSFRDGFILNLTNPKAYAAFFALYSAFLLPLESEVGAIILTGLVGFSTGVVVDLIWTLLGASLSNFIKHSPRAFLIRKACGAFLLLILVYSMVKTVSAG